MTNRYRLRPAAKILLFVFGASALLGLLVVGPWWFRLIAFLVGASLAITQGTGYSDVRPPVHVLTALRVPGEPPPICLLCDRPVEPGGRWCSPAHVWDLPPGELCRGPEGGRLDVISVMGS